MPLAARLAEERHDAHRRRSTAPSGTATSSGASTAWATSILIGVTWLTTTTVLPAYASSSRVEPGQHPLLDLAERLAAAAGRRRASRARRRARRVAARAPRRRSARPRCRTPSRRSRLLDQVALERARRGSRPTRGSGVPARRRPRRRASADRRQPLGDLAHLGAALVGEAGVAAGQPAGEPLVGGVRGAPCRTSTSVVTGRRAATSRGSRRPRPGSARPRGSAPPRPPSRGLVGSGRALDRVAGDAATAGRRAPRWRAGRRACSARAAPRCTSCPDGAEPVGLDRQRPHVGVLDLPAAAHLLDDELGVHPDLDRRRPGASSAASSSPAIRPRYSATLLLATPMRGALLGEHLAGVGVLDAARRTPRGRGCRASRRRPRR